MVQEVNLCDSPRGKRSLFWSSEAREINLVQHCSTSNMSHHSTSNINNVFEISLFLSFTWKCFKRNVFNHYHSTGKFSRQQIDVTFLNFHRNRLWQIVLNIKVFFLEKKIFQNVVYWIFYPACYALRNTFAYKGYFSWVAWSHGYEFQLKSNKGTILLLDYFSTHIISLTWQKLNV